METRKRTEHTPRFRQEQLNANKCRRYELRIDICIKIIFECTMGTDLSNVGEGAASHYQTSLSPFSGI